MISPAFALIRFNQDKCVSTSERITKKVANVSPKAVQAISVKGNTVDAEGVGMIKSDPFELEKKSPAWKSSGIHDSKFD